MNYSGCVLSFLIRAKHIMSGVTIINLCHILRTLMERNGTMKTCKRCGTKDNLTHHHILPRAFNHSRKNKRTICLCENDHRHLELIILQVESTVGRVKFGNRYKLTNSDYFQIVKNFVKNRCFS